MKKVATYVFAGALALVGVGCGSDDDSCGDGGCPDGGQTADGSTDGIVPFGLTEGNSCFAITAIAPGANDGCDLGVADLVGTTPVTALPVTYTPATATVAVGTSGALGSGQVTFNMGTLTRENDPMQANMPTCTWHQRDDSQLRVIANDRFTIAVTEVRSNFASVCNNPPPPTGGTCTSTWTWTMQRTTAVSPATGCQ